MSDDDYQQGFDDGEEYAIEQIKLLTATIATLTQELEAEKAENAEIERERDAWAERALAAEDALAKKTAHPALDGYTDDELRAYATVVMSRHDPADQEHGYERCALCGYTRHPCDTYDMASAVLALLVRDDEA